MLSIQTTYTQARENLASFLDQVEQDSTIVLIKRRNHKDIALIAADELESLLETVYLLRSPNNARRLLEALQRSVERDAQTPQAQSLEKLVQELGIVREEEASQ